MKKHNKETLNTDTISSVSKLKNILSSMAIEDMYFSNDFIREMIKVAKGEKTSEELRQEVIEQYTK